MKRDPERELDLQLDRQIDHLARTLRETGIPPERDLWPDIDRAIERTDTRTSPLLPARNRGLAGWRIAALAASVLLLAGVGLVQQGGLPGKSDSNQAVINNVGPLASADLTGPTDGSGDGVGDSDVSMQAIDQALVDLNRALADDPDNGSLSRLVLVIHKSRGNLIRNAARRLVAPGR